MTSISMRYCGAIRLHSIIVAAGGLSPKAARRCGQHGSNGEGCPEHAGKINRSRDRGIEDCSIAALCLQLAATSLGLGSCWAQLRLRRRADGRDSEEYVRELLGLPAHFTVDCIIGIGYPGEQPAGHPLSTLPFRKIHRERFSVS